MAFVGEDPEGMTPEDGEFGGIILSMHIFPGSNI